MNYQTVKSLILVIKIAIFIVAIGSVLAYCNERKERKIYEQNINNMLVNQAREVSLLPKEFKKALDERTRNIIDSIGIKTKQIDRYIQTDYKIKDTTITHTATVYDSVHNNYRFTVMSDCWTIGGYIKPSIDGVVIDHKELNDTIDIFQYHNWDKKILWGLIKWKRYDVAGVYSRCKKDTIKIIRNYKVR